MTLLPPSPTVSVKTLVGLGVVFCTLLCGFDASANCLTLFRQKKFEAASRCFVKQAEKVGPSGTLSSTQKIQKGRLLRNAALTLTRGAKQSSSTRAAGMRSKAITLLKRYLSEGLFESSGMKSNTEKQLQALEKQIGYTNLTVVTNHPAAEICLQAGSFKKCKRAMLWTLKLLPKTYQTTVTYPLKPPVTQSKVLTALPRTRKTLVFTPPVKSESLLSIVTGDTGATMSLQNLKTKKSLVHRGGFWSKTLSPGVYQLKLIYPGRPAIQRTVTMKKGRPEILVFRKPGPPVLIINTTPINAQVYIDGKYRGNTGIKLKLKVGQRNVELRRGCFVIYKKMLTLKPNEERSLSVVLQRDAAYIKWKKASKGSGGAIAGWSVLAVGALAAGTGGVMQGLASGKHGEALTVRGYDLNKFQTLADEGNTFRTVGYTGIAVGVVGIGVGIATLIATRPVARTSIPCQVPLKEQN